MLSSNELVKDFSDFLTERIHLNLGNFLYWKSRKAEVASVLFRIFHSYTEGSIARPDASYFEQLVSVQFIIGNNFSFLAKSKAERLLSALM